MNRFLSNACYIVIIFFTFYDSLLVNCNYTQFVSFLKIVRYLCYFWLLFSIFANGYIKKTIIWNYGGCFILLFAYMILVGLFSLKGFLDYGIEGFMHYKQFFVFSLMFYFFYYYPQLSGKKYNGLVRKYVFFGTVFSVVNVVLFFSHPSFMQIPFFDRFSVGYPTVDVVPQSYCLLASLFYADIGLNQLKRLVCSLVVFVAIMMQVSGSGTVFMLIIIFAFILFASITRNNKKIFALKSNFRNFVVAISVFSFLGISFITARFPEIVEKAFPILENRLLTLIGKNNESSLHINTFEIRNNQFKKSKRYYEDKLIFGTGYGPVSILDGKRQKKEYVFIENQYRHNIIVIGYVGAMLFILFVAENLLQSILCKDRLSFKIMYILSSLIFLLASNNICTLDILQSFVPFCLFWGMRENRKTFKRVRIKVVAEKSNVS